MKWVVLSINFLCKFLQFVLLQALQNKRLLDGPFNIFQDFIMVTFVCHICPILEHLNCLMLKFDLKIL